MTSFAPFRPSMSSYRRSFFFPCVRSFRVSLQANSGGGDGKSAEGSEIIFIGTGTSEGIPSVSCLTNPSKKCTVCSKAVEPGNKNKRRNTSLLIRRATTDGTTDNILIDAGKIRTIDAVVVTHSHADTIRGLDDLRDWTNNVQPYIPIYVAKRDFEVMKKTHYYLVDTSVILEGAAVSELQFNLIDEQPFMVRDLKITPLPVWHGAGYRSLGFRFGKDAVRPDRSSTTHFGLQRALEEVRKIRPKHTLFTGMMHLMDHEAINENLQKLTEAERSRRSIELRRASYPCNSLADEPLWMAYILILSSFIKYSWFTKAAQGKVLPESSFILNFPDTGQTNHVNPNYQKRKIMFIQGVDLRFLLCKNNGLPVLSAFPFLHYSLRVPSAIWNFWFHG